MAERFMPIGQFMPSASRLNNGHIPSTYATRAPGDSARPSFQEIMDNTENPSPVNPKSVSGHGNSYASSTPFDTQTALQEGWTVVSPGSQDAGRGANPSINGNIPLDSKTNAETNLLLQNMPPNVPQGENLANLMLKNMREYQESKAAQVNQSAPAGPASRTTPAFGLESQMVAEPDFPNAPLPSSTLSGVYSGGAESMPIQPPSMRGTAVTTQGAKPAGPETWTSADGTLIQFPSGDKPAKAASRKESTPLSQSEPAQPTERKGFFQAIGSFFGDVASGLTLGIYRPKNEPAPQGVERIFYPVKKLIFDAPVKDIAVGIPMGIYYDAGRALSKSEEPDSNPDASQAVLTPPSASRRRSTSNVSLSDLNHPQRAFRRKAEA